MTNTAELYELILNNEALHYIDPVTDTTRTARDFHESLDIDNSGGLVFLFADNQIQTVELLLNLLRSNFTIALLNPALNQEYKAQLESRYQPYYIYDLTRPFLNGYDAITVGTKHHLFKQRNGLKTEVNPQIKLLINTSGSTGSPKFVKLSAQNLLSNALSILDYLPIKAFDVAPLNLPLFYSYGLSVFTTNSIGGGGIVCSNSTIMQKEFWQELERYQYTSLAGVPYVYEMLQRLGFLDKTYPSLRYFTQAGGRMDKGILSAFANYAQEKELSFYAMYGQTEATARISFVPPEQLLSKIGSIGKPIKDGELDINPLSGELRYYGPNIYGGYATEPADLLDYCQKPVLYTGDLARRDADGYFYITGRSKRFVKLFGTRINLDDVEQILKENFSGMSFICIGEEDKYLTVAHLDDVISGKAIKDLLYDKVKVHPQSVKVKLIAELPLNANGKIDYNAAALKEV